MLDHNTKTSLCISNSDTFVILHRKQLVSDNRIEHVFKPKLRKEYWVGVGGVLYKQCVCTSQSRLKHLESVPL